MVDTAEKYIQGRLETLERIYALYDQFMGKQGIACRAGCNLCCTRNVATTALEACLIADHLKKTDRDRLFDRVRKAANLKRFQPQTTTNTLVWLAGNGKNPPEEEFDPAWRPCPLLSAGRCLIYDVRPFGCRCMVSKTVCRKGGHADMEAYLLSINTVFMQFVEHTDAGGRSGNFIDLLLFMSSRDRQRAYKKYGRRGSRRAFVANRPIEMILLEPQYRSRALPILNRLQDICSKQER